MKYRLENNKYELTDETLEWRCHTLYRIKALKDFSDVHKGDLGGWIEKESNLSQDDDCWAYDDAKVYGNAKVFGNANIFDNAEVHGNAKVYDNARVCDDAEVYDHAGIADDALIYDNVKIGGTAEIGGDTDICTHIISDDDNADIPTEEDNAEDEECEEDSDKVAVDTDTSNNSWKQIKVNI